MWRKEMRIQQCCGSGSSRIQIQNCTQSEHDGSDLFDKENSLIFSVFFFAMVQMSEIANIPKKNLKNALKVLQQSTMYT